MSTVQIPNPGRLALAVQLDELGGDDPDAPLGQTFDDRVSAEAIASAALDYCQRYERVLIELAALVDDETIQTGDIIGGHDDAVRLRAMLDDIGGPA